MQHLTLDQVDHALEWHMRRLVTKAGYWPDLQKLLTTAGTPADLEREKKKITAAGRELIEVFGPAPWAQRGQSKGNSIVISRLTMGRGSYTLAQLVEYAPVDPADLTKGYTTMHVADSPQDIRYEVRYLANDSKMDRQSTTLILQAFGVARYLHGLNNDLTDTEVGFWVVPQGDSLDMSEDDFTERVWRIEVRDVQVIPALEGEHVSAAISLGPDLHSGEESVTTIEVSPES